MRSFLLAPGFMNSIFAKTAPRSPRVRRESSTIGVFPMREAASG
jgi:hypothetical protein